MNKIKSLKCAIAVGAALAVLGAAAAADPRDDRSLDNASLVGTWQVIVTVRLDAPDCTTSPPVPVGPNPFPSLNTFHVGGTMSETGSRSPPSMRSPGHGVWERTGRKNYEARYTFQGFDVDGVLATNMDIRSRITLTGNGDTFTGISRLNFGPVGGTPMPFCATLEGARFTL